MKKVLCISLVLYLLLGRILIVNATSGQLKKDSIKVCNGITYGQHGSDNHWHVAEKRGERYYPEGGAIYTNPCGSNEKKDNNQVSSNNKNSNSNQKDSSSKKSNISKNNDNSNNKLDSKDTNTKITTNNVSSKNEIKSEEKEEYIKSNDNTLKLIIVDGKSIGINDKMQYSTKNEKVEIEVEVNDKKATYDIKNNSDLKVGNNSIIIEVKAENGNIKNYFLNISRERILSSETGIKIFINEEEVILKEGKGTSYVSSTTDEIKIDYTLIDLKSKVNIDKIEEIKSGENKLSVLVIAEDGTEKTYEIVIYKYTKIEEIITTILALGITGGAGYTIYFAIKKIGRKLK